MFGLDLFKAKDSANANTNANTGDSNSLTMEQPSSPQAPSNRWIVSEQRPAPEQMQLRGGGAGGICCGLCAGLVCFECCEICC